MANLQAQKPKFSMVIKSDVYQNLIKQTLGDPKKAERYTAAIMSAVATNPQLQQCEAKTILSGSLLAESLGLAHSPQLGQYYLVPFKVKAKNGVPEHYDATFILGYKGYIQLAVRSGNYKKINVMEIKEGEFISYNPFDEEVILQPMQDVDERERVETIGYYAMFEYINGFKKVMYWSKAQMLAHADRFSPAFSKVAYEKLQKGEIPQQDLWRYSSFWYKNFDEMAKKTMLRQLISKWGIMSTEMTQAVTLDNTATEISQSGIFETIPESGFEATEIEPQEEPKETAEEVDFNAI